MIKRLIVENYALIDSLDIAFSRGLNTVTGETGAGKSLLLGALSVLLGGKAEAAVLGDKTRPCVVEAEFDIAGFGLEPIFEGLDLDYADTVVLRRVINPAGKSRAFVSDLPVTVAALREIGGRLVDIHSQHQTLLLSNPKFQIDLVDSVAADAELLKRYTDTYDRWRASAREWEQLRDEAESSRRDEEYLRFQAAQLAEAALLPGEPDELEAAAAELTHAAEIREALGATGELLCGEESGVLARLKGAQTLLGRVAPVFAKASAADERLRAAAEEIKDVAAELAADAERVEVDPARLEATEARLDLINTLLQKHRMRTIEELIEFRGQIEEKLAGIAHADEAIARLAAQTGRLHDEARTLAGRLSAARAGAAPAIERQVVEMTAQLGMPAVQFRVEIAPTDELTPVGADRIAFLFTANKNMPPQPVEKIASGGEMSRLMLSLKSLTARHRQLPTIIFDEIDTGVSGEIADRMGRLIDELSTRLQVINITHLPQVASKGDTHFRVYKEETPTATRTAIRRLGPEERVEEIARMLSGARLTEAALTQARTLLDG